MHVSLRFALLPLFLAACTGEDPEPTPEDTDTGSGSGTDTDTGTDTADTGSNIPAAECVEEGGACVLSGQYTTSMRLTADKPWLLRSGVKIGDDSAETILEIEAGTTVYGESATNALLIIQRGSKIQAIGTADKPIVFTSDQPEGSRSRGDWGGLVLNGRAPINACTDGTTPCEAEGEGNTGTYGGDDWADSSGTLKYVVVEFVGTEVSPDNEVNGIGLQGVGSGTSLDYVQIHQTLDDCIEFWGGAATAKHIVCTSPGDDGIDFDLGFRGKVQFAVVQQSGGTGNNGMEADNNPDVHTAEPGTTPTFANLTLIGDPTVEESNFGLLWRRGFSPMAYSVAADGFSSACLSVRDAATYDYFASGDAGVWGSAVACDVPFETGDDSDASTEEAVWGDNAVVSDLKLKDAWNTTKPDFRLDSGSPLATGGATPSDSFFEQVDYIGAFDGTTDWTAGWTRHDAD